MTLLITIFAAIISTIVWYFTSPNTYKLGLLCVLYWGASIMWLVDAVFEYAELGADYFSPAAADMINDSYLGVSVAALGLIIWLVRLLISDPKKVIAKMLVKEQSKS